MTPRAKLADVAAKAGVSVSAVSLVLNGKGDGNIAPATRDRILAAVRELDYRPNSVAQSLRRQRTHAVGLITDSIASSPFAGRLVAGAMDVAADRGYVLLLVDSQNRRDREQAAVEELSRRQVDGFLYATMGLTEISGPLPTSRLPLVLANCYVGSGHAGDRPPSVIPDDVGGGRVAAEHLLSLGHRRIAMLGGPGPRAGRPTVGNVAGPLRARGFRTALRAAGLDPNGTVHGAGWNIGDGFRAAMAVLAGADGRAVPSGERATALFCVNDRVATGALLAAARLGLDVPGDLSVVGFDDQEAVASEVVPALTTLALPHRAMGERSMGMLLASLHPLAAHPSTGPARAPSGPVLLPCPLIIRDSTGVPGY